MTTDLADIPALRQAIRQLSRREREELAEWILNSPDTASWVAEAALPYGGKRYFTVEEYLNFDEGGLIRYEYVAGRIFAMCSPLIRHEMIAANLMFHFQNQLRETPCKAFSSNTAVRLKVDRDDIFYLPDVTVACGPFTDEVLNTQWLINPCLVAEVLSPSTESIDRREKALNYRHISGLEEYILIAQRTVEVTVFRRSDNWRPLVLTSSDDVFESRAVEVNIALADIYEGVR
jgi:Uma2 family endonuclease